MPSRNFNAEVNLATDRERGGGLLHGAVDSAGSTAQDLGVSALVYDMEAHYNDVRRKWFDIAITHSDGRREVLEAAPRPGR